MYHSQLGSILLYILHMIIGKDEAAFIVIDSVSYNWCLSSL